MSENPSKKRSPKQKVVAFKVEEELADILASLPNKSEFIRRAIAAQLGTTCPLCKGEGIVSRDLHDRAEEALKGMKPRGCDSCGDTLSVPDASELRTCDRERLQQFFLGGPLYCDSCYTQAPTCDDCGWHIDSDHISEHQEQAHASELD